MAIKINNVIVIDDTKNFANVNGIFTSANSSYGTTGQVLTSDGANVYWAAASGGGFSNVTVLSGTTSVTAVKSRLYVITSTPLTLTLPASPASGDLVGVSNRSGNTDAIVARNSSNIMSLAEDLTVDSVDAGFTLVYSDATRGWVIV